jgi:hypothetical protein
LQKLGVARIILARSFKEFPDEEGTEINTSSRYRAFPDEEGTKTIK